MEGYKVSKQQINERVDKVVGLAEQLMDDDRVEAGWDFFDSVKKNALSIKENVQKVGHGTNKQQDALDNMHKGLVKWENQLEE